MYCYDVAFEGIDTLQIRFGGGNGKFNIYLTEV